MSSVYHQSLTQKAYKQSDGQITCHVAKRMTSDGEQADDDHPGISRFAPCSHVIMSQRVQRKKRRKKKRISASTPKMGFIGWTQDGILISSVFFFPPDLVTVAGEERGGASESRWNFVGGFVFYLCLFCGCVAKFSFPRRLGMILAGIPL